MAPDEASEGFSITAACAIEVGILVTHAGALYPLDNGLA